MDAQPLFCPDHDRLIKRSAGSSLLKPMGLCLVYNGIREILSFFPLSGFPLDGLP
jgi:hypothetical protein